MELDSKIENQNSVNENKKPIQERIISSLTKFWQVYILGGAAIITVITKYQTLVDWIRAIDMVHLPKPILIVLVVIAIIGVIIAIYYMRRKTPAPNIAVVFFVISALSGGLISVQQGQNFNKVIVVYDNSTLPYHPTIYDYVETQKIEDLNKLEDIGQFNKNTIVISTLERPVLKWRKILPIEKVMESPLLTLQEVIDEYSTGFIDISFSDFDKDILHKIKNDNIENIEIRVFYEYGYEPAERKLRETLENYNSELIINSSVFNPKSFKKMLEPTSTTIFLGSSQGMHTFLNNTTNTDYFLLLMPNWLRPNLPKSNNVEASNRICLVSSVFDNLVKCDLNTWDIIFKATKSDWTNEENLKNKILSSFVHDNQLREIKF